MSVKRGNDLVGDKPMKARVRKFATKVLESKSIPETLKVH